MVCPYCHSRTQIVNSRSLARANGTWRRRRCLKCGAIITTIEEADYSKLWVIKSDQNIQPFLRDKLFLSIYDSLRHRRTPIADANALTSTIVAKLPKIGPEGQISRQELTETVHSTLRLFDKPAATYYLAYYAKV